jgi:hypothetical protein
MHPHVQRVMYCRHKIVDPLPEERDVINGQPIYVTRFSDFKGSVRPSSTKNFSLQKCCISYHNDLDF